MKYEVDTAIRLLTDNIMEQNKFEEINILDAVGRVCAEDVIAKFPVPSYSKSAMDGYAVKSKDINGANKYQPSKLKVLANIYAGDIIDVDVQDGTAVKIMTGAKIPDGYDSVVRQEDTNCGVEVVEIYKEVYSGENYCAIGEDIQKDEKVFSRNTVLTPQHIGILASLGYGKVKVLKNMRVGIISTGSEVAEPGEEFGENKIFNSTTYHIASLLHLYGIEVVERKHCKDDAEDIAKTLCELTETTDMIITTGGISVGDKDLLPIALKNVGAEILFRGANIKPGTPVTGAYLNNTVILCCSGNPFACLVNFDVFFWPVVAKFMNCKKFNARTRYATLAEGEVLPKKYTSYTRAFYENGEVRVRKDGHNSSIMSSTLGTNCFVINDGHHKLEVGDTVKIQFFRPFRIGY